MPDSSSTTSTEEAPMHLSIRIDREIVRTLLQLAMILIVQ